MTIEMAFWMPSAIWPIMEEVMPDTFFMTVAVISSVFTEVVTT